MVYQVLTANDSILITDEDSDLKVQVSQKGAVIMPNRPAYCMATLYRIKGGFIPEKIFLFHAITAISLEDLKGIVDFYFTTLMETELYVKEVPQDSSFFPQEALRLYGKKEEILNDGTVSVICPGRSE